MTMKLLYIDICQKTINPTNSLIPALLRQTADVVCYGPGFVSQDELRGGIARFVEKRGDFDFLVTTFLKFEMREKEIQAYSRYTYPRYSFDQVNRFTSDVSAFFDRNNVSKILFLTALDTYAINEHYARLIAETNGHIVAWADGFSRPIDELKVLSTEEFFFRYKGRDFDLWRNLVAKYRHKFINFGHFLGETEFNWTVLDDREDKVVVPGQMYTRRETARRKLAKQGILARTGKLRYLLSAMDHAGLRPYSRPMLQSLYYQTFVQRLGSARYAYTDGSGVDYPIRKFFEMPALGTVLLCTPCAGFEDLGFSDRKNAVVVSPDGIDKAVEWLRKSPAQAQQIADAGRKLIWERHSLHARAEQLARCLKSISDGRFLGSHWDKGEFVVDERLETLDLSHGGTDTMHWEARPC
jgi:hypothetical protein